MRSLDDARHGRLIDMGFDYRIARARTIGDPHFIVAKGESDAGGFARRGVV